MPVNLASTAQCFNKALVKNTLRTAKNRHDGFEIKEDVMKVWTCSFNLRGSIIQTDKSPAWNSTATSCISVKQQSPQRGAMSSSQKLWNVPVSRWVFRPPALELRSSEHGKERGKKTSPQPCLNKQIQQTEKWETYVNATAVRCEPPPSLRGGQLVSIWNNVREWSRGRSS